MDKQIIIDGVDVSKCVHLQKGIDCNAYIDFLECCDGYDARLGYCPNIDCYYKQLKRKEQECERLEKAYAQCSDSRLKFVNIANELEEQLEAYKMEAEEGKEINAELKAENERLKQAFAESDNDCFRLEKENNLLKVYRSIAPFKVKMLVQTFTEIKPILEFYANSKIGEEQVAGTYKIMLSDGYVMAYDPKPARQALQKISEVVDGNN